MCLQNLYHVNIDMYAHTITQPNIILLYTYYSYCCKKVFSQKQQLAILNIIILVSTYLISYILFMCIILYSYYNTVLLCSQVPAHGHRLLLLKEIIVLQWKPSVLMIKVMKRLGGLSNSRWPDNFAAIASYLILLHQILEHYSQTFLQHLDIQLQLAQHLVQIFDSSHHFVIFCSVQSLQTFSCSWLNIQCRFLTKVMSFCDFDSSYVWNRKFQKNSKYLVWLAGL